MENKYKIFISSVQKEFEQERIELTKYINTDALLKSFFEPFIFENIAANTKNPEKVFTFQIKQADIYLGIFGKDYGYEDKNGISPTEKEYDIAKNNGIPRWIYILKTTNSRHPKEDNFIRKVSGDVSWKFFQGLDNLKKEVYHVCIEFLKQRGKIENSDFDSILHRYETINGIDDNLLRDFIVTARKKRNFPEKEDAPKADILKRLNLARDHKIVNSALLIFSNNPQQYFPTATVKCAHFHGVNVQKPIPDYKEFSGTIFEMADHAVDFVLSKISLSTGTRDKSNLVETRYEIPRAVIAEAVINALVHRDYYSKGSVQISIFKNRIEIENPGRLPDEISLEDLKKPHASYPQNPLLAHCLFLAGSIERYGTGTVEMTNLSTTNGLPEPEFASQKTFKVTLWRNRDAEKNMERDRSTAEVKEQVKE
ncbi:MAG: DUF4062 domain-containing protein, partial [Candidatus Marinimicrobia bacterium]|nr:DUF4062 domain-containing protein [Candidatus Neomarinimicrobiota bacterium]